MTRREPLRCVARTVEERVWVPLGVAGAEDRTWKGSLLLARSAKGRQTGMDTDFVELH